MFKLREIERKDVKTINKWRNDEELIACLGAPFRFISEAVDEAWYDNYMRVRSSTVRLAIVREGNVDDILGLISLVNINTINGTAELHIMIGDKENRGKGMGTFAVKSVIEHAFNNMNLRRIELVALENNTPAIALYEKCGFIKEGLKRLSHLKNGKYVNTIIMGLLKDEYNNL